MPTLPPSCRMRLNRPVPLGIFDIGRSASPRFVSGTKIRPRPTPRKMSGQKKSFMPLIFRGVGLGLIFVPLTNLALADLPMSKIPNGTGLFNLLRQLGGSVGIAISATLVQRFTAIHRADLIANVTQYSEAARERLSGIVGLLIAKGTPAP